MIIMDAKKVTQRHNNIICGVKTLQKYFTAKSNNWNGYQKLHNDRIISFGEVICNTQYAIQINLHYSSVESSKLKHYKSILWRKSIFGSNI